MQTVDIKEISYTLEKGNRILREVEPFFAVENPNILPLIDAINIEISGFQSVYELLVQVKDESFKTQHWHVIISINFYLIYIFIYCLSSKFLISCMIKTKKNAKE